MRHEWARTVAPRSDGHRRLIRRPDHDLSKRPRVHAHFGSGAPQCSLGRGDSRGPARCCTIRRGGKRSRLDAAHGVVPALVRACARMQPAVRFRRGEFDRARDSDRRVSADNRCILAARRCRTRCSDRARERRRNAPAQHPPRVAGAAAVAGRGRDVVLAHQMPTARSSKSNPATAMSIGLTAARCSAGVRGNCGRTRKPRAAWPPRLRRAPHFLTSGSK